MIALIWVLFSATPQEAAKRTLVDFSDVNIQGELRKPEGDIYSSRKRTRFNKLIRVRPNFVPEIVASTDNL